MLRWVSYGIDLLAGCLLLCAPVIILHWLITALGVAEINTALLPVTNTFQPIYTGFEGALPIALPVTAFNGQTITMIPMVLAITLILTFSLLAAGSSGLRRLETTLTSGSFNVDSHRARHQQAKTEAEQRQRQAALSRNIVLLLVTYPFQTYPEALKQFSQQPSHRSGDVCLFQFSHPEPALNFAMTSYNRLAQYGRQQVTDGYTAQPAVTMALHAFNSQQGMQAGVDRCRMLIRYGQADQVLFSQQLFEVMGAQNIATNFAHYSLGVYNFPNEAAQDIYQLDIRKPEQQVYF